jgi:hypothetical protein
MKPKKTDKPRENDVRVSMFYLYLLEEMDAMLDHNPPHTWNRLGECPLGDTASPFVQKFLTPKMLHADIPRLARFEYKDGQRGQAKADIYQQLNMLGQSVKKIGAAAQAWRAEPSEAHDEAYIQANRELHVLSVICMLYTPQEVAPVIRKGAAEHRSFDEVYADLCRRFPNSVALGNEVKLTQDVIKWVSDLRMEVEHAGQGFHKSNQVLRHLEKQGIDLKSLYRQYSEYYPENKPIPFDALPEPVQDFMHDKRLDPADFAFTKTEPSDIPGKKKPFSRAQSIVQKVHALSMVLPKSKLLEGLYFP